MDAELPIPGAWDPAHRDVGVLVVSRNELMRRGLSSIAERGGLTVVDECPTPEAALDVLRRALVSVAVLDADDRDCSTTSLAELAGACQLLVLVPDGDVDVTLAALLAGARGCISRSSPADVLLAEMQVTAHGETVIPSRTVDELLRMAGPGIETEHDLPAPVRERLTTREMEVLVLVANGWDNARIGAVLFISPRTVKNHVASILEKLELENRVQAAVCAVRNGLL